MHSGPIQNEKIYSKCGMKWSSEKQDLQHELIRLKDHELIHAHRSVSSSVLWKCGAISFHCGAVFIHHMADKNASFISCINWSPVCVAFSFCSLLSALTLLHSKCGFSFAILYERGRNTDAIHFFGVPFRLAPFRSVFTKQTFLWKGRTKSFLRTPTKFLWAKAKYINKRHFQ